MRVNFLFSVTLMLLIGACGCSRYYSYRNHYRYQYRAGTTYEYDQLMEAYDSSSGNLPPLPPLSDEPGEGQWVRVPVREEPAVVYEEYEYGPDRTVYVVDRPYYYGYPGSYYGSSYRYGGSRGRRRSGVSVGIGFSTSPWGHSSFGHGHGFSHFGHGLHCWP